MDPFDPNLLAQLIERDGLADIELRWGASADGGSLEALSRRELALEKTGRATQLGAARVAPRTCARIGRPRKLSWYGELEIAIFMATRRLERRLMKNAISDAMKRFNVSRAAITRADRKHRADAAFLACAFRLNGRKRFRKIITSAKPVHVPDFRDWSADDK